MENRTLFHTRESVDRSAPGECWYLVHQTDGSYWVEHTHDHADAAEPPVTISIVRVGRFFAHTEDPQLLGLLRAALAKAVL